MATLLDPDRSVTAPGRGLLTVLLIGQAMATTDGSILVILANSIRHDLPASDIGRRLIVAGYLFAFAVLVVTGARLGDRWGRATPRPSPRSPRPRRRWPRWSASPGSAGCT
jgi:MFS family permease